MTTADRLEQDLPELMSELAVARVPDYFDDMLRQTAATRQRPSWSSLGKWIPIGVLGRTSTARLVPWRPVVLAAILVLLTTVALAAVAGSRLRVPDLFAPSGRGLVLFSSESGDILLLDPATGATADVLGGSTFDASPRVAPDGQRFAFLRGSGADARWHVANIDGSGVVEVLPFGRDDDALTWSSGSDRLVVTPGGDGMGGIPSLVNLNDGTSRQLAGEMAFLAAIWRPGTDQLILTQQGEDDRNRFYLIDADGTNLKAIPASTYAVNSPAVSPDGASIAYVSATTPGTVHLSPTSLHASDGERPIHVLDLDTGIDRVVTTDGNGSEGYLYFDPRFSPDGSKLLVDRYLGNGYRLAIVPLDGTDKIVEIGPSQDAAADPRLAAFSPDGTEVLATFMFDGSTWLLPISGEPGRRVSGPTNLQWSWQRKP